MRWILMVLLCVGAAQEPERVEVVLDEAKKVTMTFVSVKAGTFTMGDEAEKGEWDRPHEVTLTKDFWMQTTEVTQAQWEALMGTNPSQFKGADHPVDSVNWQDCQDFLAKLNEKLKDRRASLPTEAEWEYACRAGSKGKWSFGDDEAMLRDHAWYAPNSIVDRERRTHPVGQKKPNAWGLYDMHGNVMEWCRDWYGAYGGKETDPTGVPDSTVRIRRGGSFNSGADSCRSGDRDAKNQPNAKVRVGGFRVVVTGEKKEPEK